MSADLVILAPDKNMEAALRGIISRNESVGIPPISFDLFVHPERDPGCLHRAHDFLRPFLGSYDHALVVFDRIGSGQETLASTDLETTVLGKLSNSGWGDRAKVLVIDPELEVWVWSDSPHVADCLGWRERPDDMRSWLAHQQLWPLRDAKPHDPKHAVELVLRQVGRPRSSAIYGQLASTVSFQRCTDIAFRSLIATLQKWFRGQQHA